MGSWTVSRARGAALCASLCVLVLASAGSAAVRGGVGRMTVTPNHVIAGTTGAELSFAFLADNAPLAGTTLVDVPRGWSSPQQTNPTAPGYVQVQADSCTGSRISRISGRRIVIATKCPRRHGFRLLYRRASVPQLSADGYVFLTQTRPTAAPRKTPFRPLGPRKQPVVRVRGALEAGLFMTVTSFATVGVPFGATVRVVDQFGNNATSYAGTVTLTSTDAAATLAAPYAYGATDASQHVFTSLVLRTVGTQRITATDSHGFKVASAPITVSPPTSG